MPRHEPVVAEIGPADAFHIFLPAPRTEAAVHWTHGAARSAEGVSGRLRRHALEIFVAAHQLDTDIDLRLETGVTELAQALPGGDGQISRLRSVGGLTPAALRRIDELVAARLEADCAARPSLSEMAAAARLGVDHFIRMFRQETGTTPYLYASSRRLERAMALLTQPNMSIGDAGHRTGFCSPSHFVAAFRRHMGVTPGSFRNTVRG